MQGVRLRPPAVSCAFSRSPPPQAYLKTCLSPFLSAHRLRLFYLLVQKQIRRSQASVEVRAIYYIMEGVIYQTPTVQKLIKSRLEKFTHHLNNAFGKVPAADHEMKNADACFVPAVHPHGWQGRKR